MGAMELRGLQLANVYSKQPRRVDRRRCRRQARPSTSFVDNTIDLLWKKGPEFGTKILREVP